MAINISVPKTTELKPRIIVMGVGGAGGNAVTNMIQSKLSGVEFVVANTDAQALQRSLAERKIQLGPSITQGLGAGSHPDVGRAAAEESIETIIDQLQSMHMCFIAAGMGGGTGSGAASVIAQAARDQGILTVAVVTKPFRFEGAHRMNQAERAIEELQKHVDTLIVIPNQNLFAVAKEKTGFVEAFKMADDVLCAGVRSVTDLIINPGLINRDFADVRTVMASMGKAMMGTGEAEGENRAIVAAESAINNPLLEDISIKGARAVLINLAGGSDMTLIEVDEAVQRIGKEIGDPSAQIIFGSTIDEKLAGRVRVSVIATGMQLDAASMPRGGSNVFPLGHKRAEKKEAAPASAPAATPAARLEAPMPAAPVAAAPTAMTIPAMPAPAAAPVVAAAARAPAEIPRPAEIVAKAPEPVIPVRPTVQTLPFEPPPVVKPVAMPAPAIEPRPARKPSLFERMTGAILGTSSPEPIAEAKRVAPQPPAPAKLDAEVKVETRIEPKIEPKVEIAPPAPMVAAPQPAPVVAEARPAPIAARVEAPSKAPAVTTKIEAQAIERPAPRPAEDLLDIPAFLRRKAS